MNITLIKQRTEKYLNQFTASMKEKAKNLYHAFRNPGDKMKCFYLLFIVANLCFIYTWLNHSFTVPLSGDYSLQEMTFIFNGYDDWHYFFRTGEFPQWDRSVFLGIDNIGGNSFYYLFDPFVLILLPFPRDWLLVLQGLEFVPKMVLAGMFFYWYLGSFELSPRNRTIGALAFAFSGYSMCYLWFHFIDSVAFLPLCFLGIEKIIREKDPRAFLVGFFLVAMTSYFFFVVYMIGLFMYALFRYFQTIRERNYNENMAVMGTGVLSFVFAVMLGLFVLLPGMAVAKSMPRVTSSSYLESILSAPSLSEKLKAIFTFTGSTAHNQVTPLLNFLFMADDCYYSNLLNVNWYDNMAGSLYATTPILIMFFVSVLDALRRKKWSYLIGLFIACLLIMTPIGFYLFSGFTVGYARYFILPIACMITWCCLTLERRREIPKTYLDISMVIISVLYAISCYLIIYEVDLFPSHFTGTYWDDKMILIIVCFVYLLICYLVMRPLFYKKQFSYATLALMSINIIGMCNATIICHGTSSISKIPSYPEETKIVDMLRNDENGEDFYRIYNTTATRNNSNVPLREGYSGLSDFHSVYPFNAQDFLDRSRIPHGYRNWSMGIYNRRENLETFLGTKYYMVDRVEDNFSTLSIPKAYPERVDSNGYLVYASDYDIPYGYKNILSLTEEEMNALGVNYSKETLDYLKSDVCTKAVYVNTNFIDFAFSFSTVMNTSWLATNLNYKKYDDDLSYGLYEDLNEYPLLRFAMLDENDYNRFLFNKKYNAGKVNLFGDNYPTTDIEEQTTPAKRAAKFQSLLTSSNVDYVPYDKNVDYKSGTVKKPTNPIMLLSSSTGNYARMKITVYSASWPATERNPSGEYAVCDPNDASNQVCLSTFRQENPWAYENGIRPGDRVYNYDTLRDENGNTSADYSRDVLYNSKILITAMDGKGNPTLFCEDADPSDPTTGSYISINDDDNIEWRFFDKNDRLISFARHPYVEYKKAHGYYIDRPVSKILGIVKTGTKDDPVRLDKPYLYITRNSEYQRAIDELKANAVTISKRSEDKVEFSTEYANDRFIVLNYPFQDGFKVQEVKVKDDGTTFYEDVDLYKAQGGFISFEAKSGNRNYVFTYSSPYFKLGCMATALGLFVTFLCLAYFGYRRKQEKLIASCTLHSVVDEHILKEKHRYDDFETSLRR